MENYTKDFKESVLNVNRVLALTIADKIVKDLPINDFIEKVMVTVLDEIGDGWERGEIALSQIYMSSKICEEIIFKHLPKGVEEWKSGPKMAIAVLEDQHLLGKRVLHSIIKANGYNLNDYGSLTDDEIVKKVKDDEIEVLLVSALMVPSALKIKSVIDRVGEKVKVIVGGAPFRFDKNLWKEIGAYGTADTASKAIELIKSVEV